MNRCFIKIIMGSAKCENFRRYHMILIIVNEEKNTDKLCFLSLVCRRWFSIVSVQYEKKATDAHTQNSKKITISKKNPLATTHICILRYYNDTIQEQ